MLDVTLLAHRVYLAEVERVARRGGSTHSVREGSTILACILLLAAVAGATLT